MRPSRPADSAHCGYRCSRSRRWTFQRSPRGWLERAVFRFRWQTPTSAGGWRPVVRTGGSARLVPSYRGHFQRSASSGRRCRHSGWRKRRRQLLLWETRTARRDCQPGSQQPANALMTMVFDRPTSRGICGPCMTRMNTVNDSGGTKRRSLPIGAG